jgi:hypothetical protein
MNFKDGDFQTLWGNIESLGTDFDELGASALKLQVAQKAYTDALIS